MKIHANTIFLTLLSLFICDQVWGAKQSGKKAGTGGIPKQRPQKEGPKTPDYSSSATASRDPSPRNPLRYKPYSRTTFTTMNKKDNMAPRTDKENKRALALVDKFRDNGNPGKNGKRHGSIEKKSGTSALIVENHKDPLRMDNQGMTGDKRANVQIQTNGNRRNVPGTSKTSSTISGVLIPESLAQKQPHLVEQGLKMSVHTSDMIAIDRPKKGQSL